MNTKHLKSNLLMQKLRHVLQIFLSPDFDNTNKFQKCCTIFIFLIWLLISCITILHHEYWRDEVRALSISNSASYWWEIVDLIKNEGHPALWYWILFFTSKIFGAHAALPLVGLTIGALSVGLLLFRSPLPLLHKALFTFGVLAQYEYTVMSRNYGISMLLLFLFATLYKNKRNNPFWIGLVIALLANTNLIALIIACALTCLFLWDEFIEERDLLTRPRGFLLFLTVAIITSSILLSLLTIKPDDQTLLTNAHHIRPIAEYWASIKAALLSPGKILSSLLPTTLIFNTSAINNVAVIFLIAGLLIEVSLALTLYVAFIGVGFVMFFAYPIALRHQGLLLVLMVTLYWIQLNDNCKTKFKLQLILNKVALILFIPLVLIWSDGKSWVHIKRDLTLEVSSSKALGEWINKKGYQNEIIMSEPDYIIEALPYYSNTKIYIPREKIFRNFGKSTKEQKSTLSLNEILNQAISLKQREGKTILIALGWSPQYFESHTQATLPYDRLLVWRREDWNNFKANTKFEAEFTKSTGDENYYLYKLN